MSQNFDTTNGKPFPRITNVQITYPLAPAQPVMTYTEVQCVIDSSGVQHILEGTRGEYSVVLDLANAREQIQMVSPNTGDAITNSYASYTGLMMHILAIIRRDEVQRAEAQQQQLNTQGE